MNVKTKGLPTELCPEHCTTSTLLPIMAPSLPWPSMWFKWCNGLRNRTRVQGVFLDSKFHRSQSGMHWTNKSDQWRPHLTTCEFKGSTADVLEPILFLVDSQEATLYKYPHCFNMVTKTNKNDSILYIMPSVNTFVQTFWFPLLAIWIKEHGNYFSC